jgi:hypothetical protein
VTVPRGITYSVMLSPNQALYSPAKIKDPFTGKDDERVGEAGLKDIYPNH